MREGDRNTTVLLETSGSEDWGQHPSEPPFVLQLFRFFPKIIAILSAAADNVPPPPQHVISNLKT